MPTETLRANADDPSQTKINRIGLALSGGGHRAALFAAGAFLYLIKSAMHTKIATITSVSGGGLTNAFFALMPRAIDQCDETTLIPYFRTFCTMIAGDPTTWRYVFYLTAIALAGAVSWAVVLSEPLALLLGLFTIVLAVILGPRSGGSLWGWRGTWVYVLFIVAVVTALLVSGILSFLGFSGSLPPPALLVMLLVLLVLLSFRSIVTSLAFGHTVCCLATRKGNIGLQEIPSSEITHVFCATEMHAGRHFFFTREFVYSTGLGVGSAAGTTLRAAIQASASYPGFFPFRRMRSSGFGFCVWDMQQIEGGPHPARHKGGGSTQKFEAMAGVPKYLILTDGGVYDNLGVAWFLSGRRVAQKIDQWLSEISNYLNIGGPAVADRESAVQAQSLGMKARDRMHGTEDCIVVVNSGAPLSWRSRFGQLILGEMAELKAVTEVMYNNTQLNRIQDMQIRFSHANPRGAVIDIGEVGVEWDALDCLGEVAARLNKYVESIPEPREILKELGHLSKTSAKVETTLQPIGADRAAKILKHGFIQAMISLHVRLNFPICEVPQDSFFADLVGGERLGQL